MIPEGYVKVRASFRPIGYIHIGSTDERMVVQREGNRLNACKFIIKRDKLLEVVESLEGYLHDLNKLVEEDLIEPKKECVPLELHRKIPYNSIITVKRVPRNPKPYIPGSSIKGALLSAVALALVNERKIRKGSPQSVGNSVKDYFLNKFKRHINSFPYWLAVPDVPIEKTKIVDVELTKKAGGYAYVEVYDVREIEFEFFIYKPALEYLEKGLKSVKDRILQPHKGIGYHYNKVLVELKFNNGPKEGHLFVLGAGAGSIAKAIFGRPRKAHPRRSLDGKRFGFGYLKLNPES